MKPASCLETVLKVASVFDRDVSIRSDGKGWTVDCLDAAHTSMASMHIPASSFEGYEPWGDFGLRIKDVQAHLSKAEDIALEDGRFVMRGKGWTRRMKTYVYEEARTVPDRPMAATALLDVELIKPALNAFDPKDIQAVSFTASSAGLVAEAADDKDSMTSEIAPDDMVEFTLEDPDTVYRAAYALDYWQTFVKALPRSSLVEIGFQSDYPASVDFSMDGMQGRWVIAPRIEED